MSGKTLKSLNHQGRYVAALQIFLIGSGLLYSVYIHTNKANKKKYIGITKRIPYARWENGNGYKNNQYFSNAIRKYGWNGFEHEIIFKDLTYDEACEKERYLIKKYKSNKREFGYNIEGGGNLQKEIPESTRDKMRGENNPRYNPMLDVKKREKQKRYLENKKNGTTRDIHLPHTDEHKKKISKSLKGKRMGRENKNSVKVICITTGEMFDSIADAARKYGIKSRSNISDVCNGRSRYAGKDAKGRKLIWKYK